MKLKWLPALAGLWVGLAPWMAHAQAHIDPVTATSPDLGNESTFRFPV
jgi:hypothetical protein